MSSKSMIGAGVLALALLLQAGVAWAAPITFFFTFADPSGPARATGFITFERTLLPNPGNTNFDLPDPAVLDLSVTVTGAASGNGTFTLADFSRVAWDTNGGMLDFSRELVGQPTSNDPWGTISGLGGGGDFNLFRAVGSAPNGEFFFTLCANNGTADCMELQTMRARLLTSPVPTLSSDGFGLAALLLLVVGGLFIRQSAPR